MEKYLEEQDRNRSRKLDDVPSTSGDVTSPVITHAKARKSKTTRVKKPKDMPRRPLSAYNIFFREERERMLAAHKETALASRADTDDPLPEAKIGFENMAKSIGKRWRGLGPMELERYRKLAAVDMARYRTERDSYHLNLAQRTRNAREEAQSHISQELVSDSDTPVDNVHGLTEQQVSIFNTQAVPSANPVVQPQQARLNVEDVLRARLASSSYPMLSRLQQLRIASQGESASPSRLTALAAFNGVACHSPSSASHEPLDQQQLLLMRTLQLQESFQQGPAGMLAAQQHARLQALQQHAQLQQLLLQQHAIRRHPSQERDSINSQLQYQLLLQQLEQEQRNALLSKALLEKMQLFPKSKDFKK